MSEAQCRANLTTLLQQLTAYFPSSSQVNTGNYSAVDMGVSNAAIMTVGQFAPTNPIAREQMRDWDIPLDIFQRFGVNDAATDWAAFGTFRDDLLALIDVHPRLLPTNHASEDIGVIKTTVKSDAAPYLVKRDKSGIVFMFQPLRVTVTQRIALTGGEYPT